MSGTMASNDSVPSSIPASTPTIAGRTAVSTAAGKNWSSDMEYQSSFRLLVFVEFSYRKRQEGRCKMQKGAVVAAGGWVIVDLHAGWMLFPFFPFSSPF